jgi:hypothetical protein
VGTRVDTWVKHTTMSLSDGWGRVENAAVERRLRAVAGSRHLGNQNADIETAWEVWAFFEDQTR